MNLTAHGYVQTARGMCSDEVPYEVLDQQLAEAVERVKDVEGERDALGGSLAALDLAERIHLYSLLGAEEGLHEECGEDCPHHTLVAKLEGTKRAALDQGDGERP